MFGLNNPFAIGFYWMIACLVASIVLGIVGVDGWIILATIVVGVLPLILLLVFMYLAMGPY